MRHKLSRRRLRYKPAHSAALQRNLVTSLLLYESVRTTRKRALVIRPAIDRLITVAKTRPAHVAIRAINRVVTHKNACRKTMEVLRERYAARPSGFTRIVPLGSRAGDGAAVVLLELVDAVGSEKQMPKKPKNPKMPTKQQTKQHHSSRASARDDAEASSESSATSASSPQKS